MGEFHRLSQLDDSKDSLTKKSYSQGPEAIEASVDDRLNPEATER
jgi:hypothetical protein